jgi:hypothetical protein
VPIPELVLVDQHEAQGWRVRQDERLDHLSGCLTGLVVRADLGARLGRGLVTPPAVGAGRWR